MRSSNTASNTSLQNRAISFDGWISGSQEEECKKRMYLPICFGRKLLIGTRSIDTDHILYDVNLNRIENGKFLCI